MTPSVEFASLRSNRNGPITPQGALTHICVPVSHKRCMVVLMRYQSCNGTLAPLIGIMQKAAFHIPTSSLFTWCPHCCVALPMPCASEKSCGSRSSHTPGQSDFYVVLVSLWIHVRVRDVRQPFPLTELCWLFCTACSERHAEKNVVSTHTGVHRRTKVASHIYRSSSSRRTALGSCDWQLHNKDLVASVASVNGN